MVKRRLALSIPEIQEITAHFAEAAWRIAADSRGVHPVVHDAASGAVSAIIATAACALAPRLGPEPRIADLTVGSGLSLAATAKTLGTPTTSFGVDLLAHRAEGAQQLLLADGLKMEAWQADSLTASIPSPPRANLVLVDPPLGSPLNKDQALHLGFRTATSEWAFVKRGLDWLRPPEDGGGYLLAVLPYGASWMRNGREARRFMVESDFVDTVVHLPAGLLRSSGLPISLWILTNAKQPSMRGKVQVVELTSLAERGGSRDSQRRLPLGGLEAIGQAILNPKDSHHAEIVPHKKLYFTDATVSRGRLTWTSKVPVEQVDQHAQRFGDLPVTITINQDAEPFVELRSPRRAAIKERQISQACQVGDWPVTRLAALATRRSSQSAVPGSNVYHLYLPNGLTRRVTRDRPESKSVIGVDLDLELMDPDFLVAWLNTDAGQQGREYAAGEANYIPRPSSLDSLVVPLPPLQVQREIVRTLTGLDKAESIVNRARNTVWAEPGDPAQALTRFAGILDESIVSWASELPYPVASALWALNAKSDNPGDRLEHLLHIWEAYASFTSTVLLSVAATNAERYGPELDAIARTLRDQKITFSRASFGTWKAVIERLSKTLRRSIADEDEREVALGDMGGPPRTAAERILHPEIVALLGDVAQKRNSWHGHSGVVSDHEKARRADSVETLLLRLRETVGSSWTALPLIRPVSLSFRNRVLYASVEKVMGIAPPFKREEMSLGGPIEHKGLHLAAPGASTPLPLVGLLQMLETPSDEANTCYFFNRMNSVQEARLVSYQLNQKSERLQRLDPITTRIIEALSIPAISS